jgi:hypothetical protein
MVWSGRLITNRDNCKSHRQWISWTSFKKWDFAHQKKMKTCSNKASPAFHMELQYLTFTLFIQGVSENRFED